MTVSDTGFSDGKLGATLDSHNAAKLLEAAIPGLGAHASEYLDMFVGPWCGEVDCNALSGSYEIGGVAVPPE